MRTGIFEYLRKCIATITGKDPEKEGSSALYRFYSQSTAGQMGLPASGTTPFKHSVITPVQTPPGVYYDTTGKVTKPHIYDATMGDAIRVLPMMHTGASPVLGTPLMTAEALKPFATVGAAISTTLASETYPDEWKWASQQFPINATTDITVLPAAASTKYQVSVIGMDFQTNTSADAPITATVTFAEDAGAAHGGMRIFYPRSFFKTAVSASSAMSLTFPFMGAVWYSGTANKKCTCQVSNVGAAGDVVNVYFAYRTYS